MSSDMNPSSLGKCSWFSGVSFEPGFTYTLFSGAEIFQKHRRIWQELPQNDNLNPGSEGVHAQWTRVQLKNEPRVQGIHLNPGSHAPNALFQGLFAPVGRTCFSRTKIADAESTSFTSMGSQVRVLLRPPNMRNPNFKPVGGGFGFFVLMGDVEDIWQDYSGMLKLLWSTMEKGGKQMEIEFQVAADKVKNFTESAKSRLVKQVEEYTIEIINSTFP